MQTQRLQTLASPANTEHLLDSYIIRSRKVPETATKRVDVASVPRDLRISAARAIAAGSVCSVWCEEGNKWLFIASQSLQRAREFGRPAHEIQCRNSTEDGSVYFMAVQLPDGSWCEYSE
jgi:hypothetical protein